VHLRRLEDDAGGGSVEQLGCLAEERVEEIADVKLA
jgi:hypothetical protein